MGEELTITPSLSPGTTGAGGRAGKEGGGKEGIFKGFFYFLLSFFDFVCNKFTLHL